jgi:hypothetical protein
MVNLGPPMKILLLTPPMTQLNTPYPATAYLKGFLRTQGIEAAQADPALELFLRLFSSKGLERIRSALESSAGRYTENGAQFLADYDLYARTIDAAIRFLQGKDPSMAMRIASRRFLPEGTHFRALSQFGGDGSDEEQLTWAFGALGVQDQAKYLASLYLDDLAAVVREGIDPKFLLSRYGEKLAASQSTFDALAGELASPGNLIDEILLEVTADLYRLHSPDLVAFTAPFPGNIYGAFRMAGEMRTLAMAVGKPIRLLLGGGYPNTELRELAETRVFDWFDAVTLDDGERPILCLLDYFAGTRKAENLLRTFLRVGEGTSARVVYFSDPREHDIPQKNAGTPSYDGLPLDRYLSIFELPNPMHRIWSDGRWNKLTLAHGCYWKKCSFCDVSLDYISRYDANPADLIVDRMVAIIVETGQTGFHFVDEAAPPAVLRAMAERLLERNVQVTWWGNIRFEKTFTPELCELLAASGCVAVSGGLEVASDRLLKKMNKGVTVEQVARVTKAFTNAGVLVHAYLMYGFPTQTAAETLDALERVRQLFEAGCIQSAYWHRFSVTAHSPVGRDPEKFGVILKEKRLPRGARRFARNDLPFEDPTGVDHEFLGEGLRRALYNYMHGLGFDLDVREWFGAGVRRKRSDMAPSEVPGDLVVKALTRLEKGGANEVESAATESKRI